MKHLTWTAVLAALLIVAGCNGEKETASTGGSSGEGQAVMYLPGQTTCPVSGDPIDKDIFRDVDGKRVYFCCKSCPTAFDKDPQKFLAKLDQMRQAGETGETGGGDAHEGHTH